LIRFVSHDCVAEDSQTAIHVLDIDATVARERTDGDAISLTHARLFVLRNDFRVFEDAQRIAAHDRLFAVAILDAILFLTMHTKSKR
jgi:hypothetical protein